METLLPLKCWTRAQQHGFRIPQWTDPLAHEKFPGTNCTVLSGQKLSEEFRNQAKELAKSNSIKPNLTVLLVGEDPASRVYVSNKTKTFAQAGFGSHLIEVPAAEATTELLQKWVHKLNADPSVHGILVQLPLPKHVDAAAVLGAIVLEKDVDGFLPGNVGLLATGQFTGTLSCTPFGVMALLAAYNVSLAGKNAVVIGRSNIVGKPMGLMLLSEDCTVTYAHSRTQNLQGVCAQADILVAAAGQALLVKPEFVKPGAVLIDVGMHRDSAGKLCGDIDPDCFSKASFASPVPKGVGPMTIAMLLVNTCINAWGQGKAQ